MNKYIIASGLLALMAAATSCDKYDLYPEDFDGIFTIRDSGTKDLVLYATDDATEVPFVVMKGGYNPDVVSSATLKVMNQEEFQAYNDDLGTLPYILVGDECYSFSANADENLYAQSYVFDSADKKAETAKLFVRPQKIHKWLTDHAEDIALGELTPVIPVTLVSETDSVNTYGNVTLLKVDVRTPELGADVSSTVVAGTVNQQNFSDDEPNLYVPSVNYSMPCDNPWGFTLNFVADPEIVEDYNYDFGTSYTALKPDQYEFQTSYNFAPGTTFMSLNLVIKLDGLAPKKQPYAVGIKLDPNSPIVWDSADNNPGSALKLDTEKIMIFTVRVTNNVQLAKINLTGAMVTGNDIEATEGSIANLFDGNTATYFHSSWTAAKDREAVYGSYLEITLPEAMSSFRFNMTTRNSAAAAGYPKTVYLYGTNDLSNWPTTPFAKITGMNESGKLDGAAKSAQFGSDDDPYGDGNTYKYIRFCVMESGGGSLTTPSTSVFWHASELELFGY